MIDIDCHSSGTLEGATQFAQFLKENHFPDLYYEISTNGGGVHGFVVVDKRLWKDRRLQGESSSRSRSGSSGCSARRTSTWRTWS